MPWVATLLRRGAIVAKWGFARRVAQKRWHPPPVLGLFQAHAAECKRAAGAACLEQKIMVLKTKIALSAVLTLIAAGIWRLLLPAAQLAANSSIVGQLDHSDKASLMNSLVSDGSSLAWTALAAAYVLALLFIWTRPAKSDTNNKTTPHD